MSTGTHLNQPTAAHCACCHVCHVSMRQRPRPAAGCASCKTIVCQLCLQERFPSNLWPEASDSLSWQCPKCTQSCVCKACKSKRHNQRSTAAVAAVAPVQPVPMEVDEESSLFSSGSSAFRAPAKKKKRKKRKRRPDAPAPRAVSAPPARGPSPPQMYDSYNMGSPRSKRGRNPAPWERSKQKVGLGILYDTQAPIHLKILELQKQKESAESTILEMRQLLSLMELEKQEVDVALQSLIEQATREAAAAATVTKPIFKSASACSLQEMELQAANASQQQGPNNISTF